MRDSERARLERATAWLDLSRASTWLPRGVCWRRISSHCDTDLIWICAQEASPVGLLADGRIRIQAEADEVQRVVHRRARRQRLPPARYSLRASGYSHRASGAADPGSRAGWTTGAGKIELPCAGCTSTVGHGAREAVLRCHPSPPLFPCPPRCVNHTSRRIQRVGEPEMMLTGVAMRVR